MVCKVHNKHHKTAPKDAVYIGRGSPWGNPYVIGKHGTREQVIAMFAEHTLPTLDLTPLRGKDLICFCKPNPCHGDILLKEANKELKMTQKTKPKSPKINKYDVFVFGSNEGGIHGAGAAKCAREHYDMPMGKSYGHYGKCFAIPTKSDKMEVLPDIIIEYYVKGFLAYASGKPKLTFKVTQIGCGLSHKDPSIMAAMFMWATDNVLFDEAWAPHMPTLPAEQFWGTYND